MVQEGVSFLTQVLADVIARTDPEVGSTVEQADAFAAERSCVHASERRERTPRRQSESLFSCWSGSGSSPVCSVFDARPADRHAALSVRRAGC